MRAHANRAPDWGTSQKPRSSGTTVLNFSTRTTKPVIGAVPSFDSFDDSFDKALAETVKGYYKSELIRALARALEEHRRRRTGHN